MAWLKIKNIFKIYLLLISTACFPTFLENVLPKEFSKIKLRLIDLKPATYRLKNGLSIDKPVEYDYFSEKYKELYKQFVVWSDFKLGLLEDDAKKVLNEENKEYKKILQQIGKTTETSINQNSNDFLSKRDNIISALSVLENNLIGRQAPTSQASNKSVVNVLGADVQNLAYLYSI